MKPWPNTGVGEAARAGDDSADVAPSEALGPLAPGAQSWHGIPVSSGVDPVFSTAAGSRVARGGRSWLDLYCGSGTVILGHAHPRQRAAVSAALANGATVSLRHPLEPALARRLVELVGGERLVAFFKTGSEAMHAALMTAVRATGRDVILTTGYHGWLAPLGGGPTLGLEVVRLDWGSGALEEEVAELAGRAACLVISATPDMPAAGTVRSSVEAARRRGALIVADEVKSGFRRAYPTVSQAELGIEPDLLVLSKAMANGFPLSALLGARELLGDPDVFSIFSTYASELLSFAAAHACLDELADGAYGRFAERSTALRDGLAAAGQGLGVRVVGVPTFFRLELPEAAAPGALCQALWERGLLFHPLDEVLVSAAHTSADIDEACAMFAEALAEVVR
jgi:glutamate-1-semialdehyde aminotransferase